MREVNTEHDEPKNSTFLFPIFLTAWPETHFKRNSPPPMATSILSTKVTSETGNKNTAFTLNKVSEITAVTLLDSVTEVQGKDPHIAQFWDRVLHFSYVIFSKKMHGHINLPVITLNRCENNVQQSEEAFPAVSLLPCHQFTQPVHWGQHCSSR